jgi:hypothetical protein
LGHLQTDNQSQSLHPVSWSDYASALVAVVAAFLDHVHLARVRQRSTSLWLV